MSSIDSTLAERGARYGDFPEHAFITQELKRTLHDNVNWFELADDQKEALDMVMHKIGRILNGDPNYIDSWTDIIGYTRLVEKRLIDEQKVQHSFAFDSDIDVTFGPLGTQESDDANRCSISEKLAGKALYGTDSDDVQLEKALKELFGPNVEIQHIDVRT